MAVKGSQTVDTLHKRLGKIMWEYVGMARNKEGLIKAREEIKKLREEFWPSVKIPGDLDDLNTELQKASRLADYLELGELMAMDALNREESCGGHFREEFQPKRVKLCGMIRILPMWLPGNTKAGQRSQLHKEPLDFEYIEVKQRNYK